MTNIPNEQEGATSNAWSKICPDCFADRHTGHDATRGKFCQNRVGPTAVCQCPVIANPITTEPETSGQQKCQHCGRRPLDVGWRFCCPACPPIEGKPPHTKACDELNSSPAEEQRETELLPCPFAQPGEQHIVLQMKNGVIHCTCGAMGPSVAVESETWDADLHRARARSSRRALSTPTAQTRTQRIFGEGMRCATHGDVSNICTAACTYLTAQTHKDACEHCGAKLLPERAPILCESCVPVCDDDCDHRYAEPSSAQTVPDVEKIDKLLCSVEYSVALLGQDATPSSTRRVVRLLYGLVTDVRRLFRGLSTPAPETEEQKARMEAHERRADDMASRLNAVASVVHDFSGRDGSGMGMVSELLAALSVAMSTPQTETKK